MICKLFEGKLLRRFDPANLEWQILHHTHWSNSGSIKWEPEFSAPVCPPTMPTNHVLNSPSADRSIAFLLISWVKCTVEASLSFGSNLFKLFSFFMLSLAFVSWSYWSYCAPFSFFSSFFRQIHGDWERTTKVGPVQEKILSGASVNPTLGGGGAKTPLDR